MIIIAERKKMKSPRDITLWALIITLASLFFFAIMVSMITRAFPEEILFLGIPMNFHYFIFGLFVFIFGIITSFFIVKYMKVKSKSRKRGSQKYF